MLFCGKSAVQEANENFFSDGRRESRSLDGKYLEHQVQFELLLLVVLLFENRGNTNPVPMNLGSDLPQPDPLNFNSGQMMGSNAFSTNVAVPSTPITIRVNYDFGNPWPKPGNLPDDTVSAEGLMTVEGVSSSNIPRKCVRRGTWQGQAGRPTRRRPAPASSGAARRG